MVVNKVNQLEHKILAEHTKQLGNLVRGVREVAEYANEIAKSCNTAIEESNKSVFDMLTDQNTKLDERFQALHAHAFEVSDALRAYILLSTIQDATEDQKGQWFGIINTFLNSGEVSNEPTNESSESTPVDPDSIDSTGVVF